MREYVINLQTTTSTNIQAVPSHRYLFGKSNHDEVGSFLNIHDLKTILLLHLHVFHLNMKPPAFVVPA